MSFFKIYAFITKFLLLQVGILIKILGIEYSLIHLIAILLVTAYDSQFFEIKRPSGMNYEKMASELQDYFK